MEVDLTSETRILVWPILAVAIAVWLIALTPPVYAAFDLTPFATIVAGILGGGAVHAYSQYKKTPVEVESISVATMSNVIEQLRMELRRLNDLIEAKDSLITDCGHEAAELRARIIELERKDREHYDQ